MRAGKVPLVITFIAGEIFIPLVFLGIGSD